MLYITKKWMAHFILSVLCFSMSFFASPSAFATLSTVNTQADRSSSVLPLNIQWGIFFHRGDSKEPHTTCTILLKNVPSHFPGFCHVIAKHRQDLDKWREFYHNSFEEPHTITTKEESAYIFFKSLCGKETYSYVLLDDKLIVTTITGETCPISKECRANKHLFLSNERESVRMAGEFKVYTHPTEQEKILVVLNNRSGSYTPEQEKVHSLAALLRENVNDPCVEFIGTGRDEVVDSASLE